MMMIHIYIYIYVYNHTELLMFKRDGKYIHKNITLGLHFYEKLLFSITLIQNHKKIYIID